MQNKDNNVHPCQPQFKSGVPCVLYYVTVSVPTFTAAASAASTVANAGCARNIMQHTHITMNHSKPTFIVKLGLTGVYIIFLTVFAIKHRL